MAAGTTAPELRAYSPQYDWCTFIVVVFTFQVSAPELHSALYRLPLHTSGGRADVRIGEFADFYGGLAEEGSGSRSARFLVESGIVEAMYHSSNFVRHNIFATCVLNRKQ